MTGQRRFSEISHLISRLSLIPVLLGVVLLLGLIRETQGRDLKISTVTKTRMIELASFGFEKGGTLFLNLTRALRSSSPNDNNNTTNTNSLSSSVVFYEFDKLLILNYQQHLQLYSLLNPQSSCYSPSFFRQEFNDSLVLNSLSIPSTDKYYLVLVNCNELLIQLDVVAKLENKGNNGLSIEDVPIYYFTALLVGIYGFALLYSFAVPLLFRPTLPPLHPLQPLNEQAPQQVEQVEQVIEQVEQREQVVEQREQAIVVEQRRRWRIPNLIRFFVGCILLKFLLLLFYIFSLKSPPSSPLSSFFLQKSIELMEIMWRGMFLVIVLLISLGYDITKEGLSLKEKQMILGGFVSFIIFSILLIFCDYPENLCYSYEVLNTMIMVCLIIGMMLSSYLNQQQLKRKAVEYQNAQHSERYKIIMERFHFFRWTTKVCSIFLLVPLFIVAVKFYGVLSWEEKWVLVVIWELSYLSSLLFFLFNLLKCSSQFNSNNLHRLFLQPNELGPLVEAPFQPLQPNLLIQDNQNDNIGLNNNNEINLNNDIPINNPINLIDQNDDNEH